MSRSSATVEIALFPLPHVVHFPEAELPLHVFEPRYQRLVRDLMDVEEGARRIGMVLLRRRSRGDAPEIFETGTAGRLVGFEALPDGRSNIVLRGEFRFSIERELDAPDLPYRRARVHRLGETELEGHEASALRRVLLDQALRLRADLGERSPWGDEILAELGHERRLVAVVNRLAQDLDVPALRKLELLGEDLEDRATSLLRLLRSRQRVLDLLRPYRHLQPAAAIN